MPNEVIHLRFREYTPEAATAMVRAARLFAVEKPDGKPGRHHGSLYGPIDGPVRWLAYWTKTRAVTVVELIPLTWHPASEAAVTEEQHA